MATKTSGKAGGSNGKGRRPSGKPVPIKQPKPWGMIALGVVVALVAIAIIAVTAKIRIDEGRSWKDRAAEIEGIQSFFKSHPQLVKGKDHRPGPLKYDQKPPVAGAHNESWQNCMGDVYTEPIANEHAVHSMEHGAVWIAYKKGLAKGEVAKLTKRVQGKDFLLLSPVDGLDKNISLQAWGYQLKVDKADDKRIDDFVKVLRKNATQEPGAACSGGVAATGTTPQDAPAAG